MCVWFLLLLCWWMWWSCFIFDIVFERIINFALRYDDDDTSPHLCSHSPHPAAAPFFSLPSIRLVRPPRRRCLPRHPRIPSACSLPRPPCRPCLCSCARPRSRVFRLARARRCALARRVRWSRRRQTSSNTAPIRYRSLISRFHPRASRRRPSPAQSNSSPATWTARCSTRTKTSTRPMSRPPSPCPRRASCSCPPQASHVSAPFGQWAS